MKVKLSDIIEKLKENKLRITKPRLAVAEVCLKNMGKHLTQEEIYQAVHKTGSTSCDAVSVYRILAKYDELGIISKTEFHKEAARYSLNTSAEDIHKHEHFFKCVKCDAVEPFSDCFLSKKEKELEASGYRNLSHHVEITGLCPSCA